MKLLIVAIGNEILRMHTFCHRVAVQNVIPDYSHLPDSLQRIVGCC